MAMAHSVEGRFPFLDHRVVQLAALIPPNLKMKVLNEKYILKRCAEHLIPRSVEKRPKQPYRAPEGNSFFSNGRGRDYVEAALAPAQIRKTGLFRPAAVQKLVDKFRRGLAIGIKDNMALAGVLSHPSRARALRLVPSRPCRRVRRAGHVRSRPLSGPGPGAAVVTTSPRR